VIIGESAAEHSFQRVALYLQDKHPIRDGVSYARAAEAAGFEAVWQAESRLVREATVPMAAFATSTSAIKVGSGVVNTWTRNVALLASTFVTLDDLAPGRIILGLGAWWDPLASKVGIRRTRPLQCMRETIAACRELFALKEVTFHGDFVHLDGVRIDVVHGDTSARDIPIYVGATGPKMLELAGEIADGVVLNYMVSPSYNDDAMDRIEAGARRSGRSIDDVDRPQLVVCSLDNDRTKALDAARVLLTQYLGQQPHIMKASGVSEDLIKEINARVDWPATHDQIVAASEFVPDAVVQLVSASGTPDECRAKVAEYIRHGATCPILYPLGDDVEAMITAFSPRAAG
jgi:5,10-methylenetetrahydromethanopterin reductase